jgi:hypothetical protein
MVYIISIVKNKFYIVVGNFFSISFFFSCLLYRIVASPIPLVKLKKNERETNDEINRKHQIGDCDLAVTFKYV